MDPASKSSESRASRRASGPVPSSSGPTPHNSGVTIVAGNENAAKEPASNRRLDAILRELPDSELANLIHRIGIRVDDQKRIDVASQIARALVGLPEVRDPSRLPVQSRELLHRVAEGGGVLRTPSLPAGVEALIARAILFARRVDASDDLPKGGFELILPTAYLVQLPSWQNEDPRSLRALIAQAPFETVSAIASHYLGRPCTPPLALALETAWESLSDRAALASEIERLPPVERKLLESIESGGGEVETPELLDLEREPLRMRGAKGVSASRRGAGFALERRALLIPIHPNRHVVPSEVAEIVGAERNRTRESERTSIRAHVLSGDHAPRRARFARDPGPLALALALAAREAASEIRPHVGTPRSLIVRLAQRFGRTNLSISLFAALSRAMGLWEPSALGPAAPPGSLRMMDLGPVLFATWRRGGAWDEARAESEILRASAEQRDASPSKSVREIVLDALNDLGEDSWLPWSSLEAYIAADPRLEGTERLLRRWSERLGAASGGAPGTGAAPPSPLDVARRIVLESLPALGIVDLGAETEGVLDRTGASQTTLAATEISEIALRLTPRGRAWLSSGSESAPSHAKGSPTVFDEGNIARIGSGVTTAAVLAAGVVSEIGRVGDDLELVFSQATIARAISLGIPADELRSRIEAIAPVPEMLGQILTNASTVIGKGAFALTGGFLWIDDPDVRELLRTRRQTADLFLDPSPPGGLLIAPDVDLDRLTRRCRAIGIELEGVPSGVRVAATTPPPPEHKSATRPRTSISGTPQRTRTPFPRIK